VVVDAGLVTTIDDVLGPVLRRLLDPLLLDLPDKVYPEARRRRARRPPDKRFPGMRAPASRASLSAIATACFRLRTLVPEDDRSAPRLYSRMTVLIFALPLAREAGFLVRVAAIECSFRLAPCEQTSCRRRPSRTCRARRLDRALVTGGWRAER
jgi:hypothetical protein